MNKYIKKFIILLLALFGTSLFSVILFRFVPVFYTPLMLIRTVTKGYPINHQWVPIEEISKYMPRSVVRSEDAKFYDHFGFDFEAIKKAQKYNEKHKKKKGASTITQQTAKNVFLWPARSYIRKGFEAYFTILIECFWSKERILEVYLNSIELGPGIYGVEAAAKKFYKKKAINLTLSESALFAAVLPNPIKFKINRPSAYILKRQSRIIGRVQISKPIEVDDINDDEQFGLEEVSAEPETEAELNSSSSSASSAESETTAQ